MCTLHKSGTGLPQVDQNRHQPKCRQIFLNASLCNSVVFPLHDRSADHRSLGILQLRSAEPTGPSHLRMNWPLHRLLCLQVQYLQSGSKLLTSFLKSQTGCILNMLSSLWELMSQFLQVVFQPCLRLSFRRATTADRDFSFFPAVR